MIATQIINWLLSGEEWIEYLTRINLLNESPVRLKKLRRKVIESPEISVIIAELKNWNKQPFSNHRSARQLFHKLSFLADIGLSKADKEIASIADLVLAHKSTEGIYQVLTNYPKVFGGSGRDELCWALCDAPIILYALKKFGYGEDTTLPGINYISALIRENGWPCAVSPELGKFHGPGPRDASCPFATISALKMMAAAGFHNSKAAETGCKSILDLWENSLTKHPFMFRMGTDFRKLKAPLLWFDILNVAEVLSHFPFAIKNKSFREMYSIIEAKQNPEGKYVPESIYLEYRNFDFGQKKEPSRYITLVVEQIRSRIIIN